MSLSPEEIAEIRARADIVSWIGACVSLKKRGQNHVGLCPFHTEKSPSFSVHAQKNMFYCFGCHAGGDLFAFVMQHEGLNFIEAARKIAQTAGVVLADTQRLQPQADAKRLRDEKIIAQNEITQTALVKTLWHSESGALARRYLEQRRIPATQAKHWGLGLGPGSPASEKLVAQITQATGEAAIARARELGVVGPDSQYFLMSNRLTFPIRIPYVKKIDGLHGDTVAWGGRQLTADSLGPKYLNTCETSLFKKGAALFGLDRAQSIIRATGQVIFVEGFFDVLAAERAGLGETVAALGTAFTKEHVRLVAHLAKRAILVFDADRAGEQANIRATILLQKEGMEVFIAALPKGEDPDSLVRSQHADQLLKAVQKARPALTHLLERSFADTNAGIEAKALAALTLAPVITSLRSGLAQDLYMGRLAAAVGVEVAQLKIRIGEAASQERLRHKNKSQERDPKVRLNRPNEPSLGLPQTKGNLTRADQAAGRRDLEIISEMLLFPSLRPRYAAVADYLELPSSQQLLEALADSEEPAADIIQRHVAQKALRERLCRIQPWIAENADEAQAQAEKTFQSIMIRLKCRHLDGALKDIMRQLKELESEGRATDELVRRKQDLAARKRTLRRAES